MNGIKQIFQKEMARIFRDKKMVFSVFILPVAIMIGILMVTGTFQKRMLSNIEGHTPIVYVENEPESFQQFCEAAEVKVKPVKEGEVEKVKEKILKGDVDLLLSFPENMDHKIAEYQTGDEIPEIPVMSLQLFQRSIRYSWRDITGDVQTGTFGTESRKSGAD